MVGPETGSGPHWASLGPASARGSSALWSSRRADWADGFSGPNPHLKPIPERQWSRCWRLADGSGSREAGGRALNRSPARYPMVAWRPLLVSQRRCRMQAARVTL